MAGPHLNSPYTLESGLFCGDSASDGRWLRGNLHAHTTLSYGVHTPQELVDAYAELGYDFLAITDHDQVCSPDVLDRLDPHGLVLLPGNEITTNGPHICHINPRSTVGPHWQRQIVLDRIAAEAGQSFAIMNHPNWTQNYDHCPVSLLQLLRGYIGIEIFNGLTNEEQGSGYAVNKWDMVLSAGRRVWAFANDDTHHRDDPGRAWNMVWSAQKSLDSIMAAITSGRFYASSGIIINAIRTTGMHIHLETENAERIVAITAGGRRLQTVDSNVMDFNVPADVPFVRFECWGKGEQFAWTQPVGLRPEQ